MSSERDKTSENPYESPQANKKSQRNRGPFLALAIAWTILVIGVSAVLIESQIRYEVDVPGPDIHAEFGTATIPSIAITFGFAVLVTGWVALWFLFGSVRRAR
jgi:hypothetical protein